MNRVQRGTMLVAALTAAGCEAAAPTLPTPGPLVIASAVSGGASVVHGEFSTPAGTGRRVVTLHAVQTPSGVVNGGYRVEITSTGAFFDVGATCLETRGDSAWIGGIITNTNSPAIRVGSVSYFYMFDFGKVGQTGIADTVSTARINDPLGRDLEFCTLRLVQLPRLIGLEGDVRVK